MIDWLFLIEYSPFFVSLFGLGLVVRGFVWDVWHRPEMEVTGWNDGVSDAEQEQNEML